VLETPLDAMLLQNWQHALADAHPLR